MSFQFFGTCSPGFEHVTLAELRAHPQVQIASSPHRGLCTWTSNTSMSSVFLSLRTVDLIGSVLFLADLSTEPDRCCEILRANLDSCLSDFRLDNQLRQWCNSERQFLSQTLHHLSRNQSVESLDFSIQPIDLDNCNELFFFIDSSRNQSPQCPKRVSLHPDNGSPLPFETDAKECPGLFHRFHAPPRPQHQWKSPKLCETAIQFFVQSQIAAPDTSLLSKFPLRPRSKGDGVRFQISVWNESVMFGIVHFQVRLSEFL